MLGVDASITVPSILDLRRTPLNLKMQCSLCQKSFEKGMSPGEKAGSYSFLAEQSRRRHLYYCRQKQGATRKRACSNCVRSKTRCDAEIPSCGRCRSKKRTCLYEASISTIPKSITASGTSLRLPEPFAQKLKSQPFFTILASIPHMFKQENRLPPFLHPLQPPTRTMQQCQALVRMYFETPHTTWQLIRMEHERIWFTYNSFDDWELLQASQALLTYALLRMVHKAPTGFDFPLLVSLGEIAKAVGQRSSDTEMFEDPSDNGICFEDWLFRETKRRFAVIFRFMGLLVDITDATTCRTVPGFSVVPLPCKDLLWQKQTPEDWQRAFATQRHCIHGISTDGNLIELEKTARGIISTEADWEPWCAELGELGFMSAMAGSTLKRNG